MKFEECKVDAMVALPGTKFPLKRGKIVKINNMKALVEWQDSQRTIVAITYLLSKEDADTKDSELEKKAIQAKEKLDKKKAAAEALKNKQVELEREFEETFNKVHPEILAKMKQADKLFGEAEKLSEEYGIPFRGGPFNMSYIPESLNKKWDKLIKEHEYGHDFISDLTGAYGGEYDGWQTSQVC